MSLYVVQDEETEHLIAQKSTWDRPEKTYSLRYAKMSVQAEKAEDWLAHARELGMKNARVCEVLIVPYKGISFDEKDNET